MMITRTLGAFSTGYFVDDDATENGPSKIAPPTLLLQRTHSSYVAHGAGGVGRIGGVGLVSTNITLCPAEPKTTPQRRWNATPAGFAPGMSNDSLWSDIHPASSRLASVFTLKYDFISKR